MMKLGQHRYLLDPDVAYIDYLEKNLLNHRLGMIQPQTGLTGYFLSMSPGAWKTHGTDDTTFWCCNGTALEDFGKLASSAYAHDEDGLFVNLFVATELDWPERKVRLRQETRFPDVPTTRLTFDRTDEQPLTVRLRVPGWADERFKVLVNGQPVNSAAPGSYILLKRAWKAGDTIDVDLPMPLRLEPYRDRPQQAALLAGPIVLAQQLPLENLLLGLMTDKGPDLTRAPSPVAPSVLPADIAERLKPTEPSNLHFTAHIGDRSVAFKPISESWERFAVYNAIEADVPG